MRLLVPLPHHISVMGWNQSDLTSEKREVSELMHSTKNDVSAPFDQILLMILRHYISTQNIPAYCFPTGPFLPAEHQEQLYWAPALSDHFH